MIEQALLQHLQSQAVLRPFLTTYGDDDTMAIFNQKAPDDKDSFWGKGVQYGRIVFAVDLQGDPERTMGGLLTVDILCNGDEQFPEDIEPIIRALIHGWFFSSGTFTVSAQWKASNYFDQPPEKVTGCTVTFDLLAFPILTTANPDVIARFNAWSAELPSIHVINHDPLPAAAWRPTGDEIAVYWRVASQAPAKWIRDTYHTLWRMATVKGHIFAENPETAAIVASDLAVKLHAVKRLLKPGEVPIMTHRNNTVNSGADSLKTGQLTVEATYAVIVPHRCDGTINNINY